MMKITQSEKLRRSAIQAVMWLLGAMVMIQTVKGLTSPMGPDEVGHASWIAQSQYSAELAFNHNNHWLTQALNIASTSLFGLSKLTLRIPSFLFSLLFIFGVCTLSRRYESEWVGCLLLAHLASNGMILWYFHSSRGYAALMATGLWLLIYTQKILNQKTEVETADKAAFLLLLICCGMSHLIGVGYVFLLAFSLYYWKSTKSLSRIPLKNIEFLISINILTLALLAVPAFFQIKSALVHQMFYDGGLYRDWWHSLSVLFGYNSSWGILCGLVLSLSVLCSLPWKRCEFEFHTHFVLLALCALVLLGSILELKFVYPRYLLILLIPILWAVLDGLNRNQKRIPRFFLIIAAFTWLVIVPNFYKQDISNKLVQQMDSLETFMGVVKRQVPKEACLLTQLEVTKSQRHRGIASHERIRQALYQKWANDWYLRDYKKECSPEFLLVFNDLPTEKRKEITFQRNSFIQMTSNQNHSIQLFKAR